jgi:hypothetical protein
LEERGIKPVYALRRGMRLVWPRDLIDMQSWPATQSKSSSAITTGDARLGP